MALIWKFASKMDADGWENRIKVTHPSYQRMRGAQFLDQYKFIPERGRWYLVHDRLGCLRVLGRGMTSQALHNFANNFFYQEQQSSWILADTQQVVVAV